MALLVSACSSSQPFETPPEISDILKRDNWIVLAIPDSKQQPGSIAKITRDVSGAYVVQWLGDFRRCGATNEDLGLTIDHMPSTSYKKTRDIDAKIAIELSAIKLGPEVNTARTATVTLDDVGADSVDLLALNQWLLAAGTGDRLPPHCKDILSQANIFLIGQSFRISKGSFVLKDEKGGKIKVTVPTGIPISAEAGGSVQEDGTVSFNRASYIAVKQLVQYPNGTFRAPEAIAAPPPNKPYLPVMPLTRAQTLDQLLLSTRTGLNNTSR